MKNIFKVALLYLICVLLTNSLESCCLAKDINFPLISGEITADSVNIRSGPGINFEKLRQMNNGDKVLYLGSNNKKAKFEWVKLVLPRNSQAFVSKDFINIDNEFFGTITGNRVNVRAGKGANFNVIGQLDKKERVEIISVDKEWVKIYPYNNCFAWVHSDFLKQAGSTKDYLENENKIRNSIKLLLDAQTYEKNNKNSAIKNKDLSKIKQKYSAIVNQKVNSPAIAKAKEHLERLKLVEKQLKQKPLSKKSNIPTKKKPVLKQPNTEHIAEGKLIEAGRFFRRPGTHRLIVKGKTINFLKSDVIDLNKYIYHKVQIWGEVLKNADSRVPVIKVEYIKKLN